LRREKNTEQNRGGQNIQYGSTYVVSFAGLIASPLRTGAEDLVVENQTRQRLLSIVAACRNRIADVDGELSKRDERLARAHLAASWQCRAPRHS
jgi:hypothetical protein